MPDGRWRGRPLSPALASEPLALVARFIRYDDAQIVIASEYLEVVLTRS